MEENKCILIMKDLLFKSFKYELTQKPTGDKQELHIEHGMKYSVHDDNVEVEITTTIACKQYMNLELCTVGQFELNKDAVANSEDKESIIDFVIKNNTVAIMYPYIRAHVTMLTSQPSMLPIMLQPIDVVQMVANAVKIDD